MDYKAQILRKLIYSPELRFSDMQIEGMTSKHFTYYLNQLVDEGLIAKKDRYYYLTIAGKDFIGRLDLDTMQQEKQPKVSVAINVRRKTEGGYEFLLSKRLKQPYLGKVGGFIGKVRFGEKLEDAARRELLEESGMTGDFKYVGILRKMARNQDLPDAPIVQDQFMVFFLVDNPRGELLEELPENKNFWVPEAEIATRDDLFNTYIEMLEFVLTKHQPNPEMIAVAEGY